jgi:oligoendopeptidase F
MQYLIRTFSAGLLLVLVAASAHSEQGAQDRAAALHAQLAEVQTQQANLQMRLAQLEEALKPENIANSLAGVGSTHPEQLREQRRQQLEKEKAGVSAQLNQLAISQRRLETAIAQADVAAYQQSALPGISSANTKGPNIAPVENSNQTRPRTTRHRKRRVRTKRSAPRS